MVKTTLKGSKLIIEADLDTSGKLSKSGKTFLLAGTGGFAPADGIKVKIDGVDRDVKIGLNVIGAR